MIDPNVWVSALINPYGSPAWVVEAVVSGQVVAIASQRLLDELITMLTRPKFQRWLSLADAAAFVEALAGTAELLADPETQPQRVRDPYDDYSVELAKVAGAADVTGDRDLLEARLEPPAITPCGLLLLSAHDPLRHALSRGTYCRATSGPGTGAVQNPDFSGSGPSPQFRTRAAALLTWCKSPVLPPRRLAQVSGPMSRSAGVTSPNPAEPPSGSWGFTPGLQTALPRTLDGPTPRLCIAEL